MLFDFLFKTVVVGNSKTGKTSIIQRYFPGIFEFNVKYSQTIGVGFGATDLTIQTILRERIEDYKVRIQIMETSAHDRFSDERPIFYGGSYGVFLIFDLSNKASFLALPKWAEEVRNALDDQQISMILIGNKNDLKEEKVVSSEEISKYLNAVYNKLGKQMPYYEVSAKTGENIKEIFQHMVALMIKRQQFYVYQEGKTDIKTEKAFQALIEEFTDKPIWIPKSVVDPETKLIKQSGIVCISEDIWFNV
jgi:small GTP-binding protein